jgi:predicted ester cyclase
MSEAIFRAHIEQIWNNKDAGAIERFIAPQYRGFDADEVISGIEAYKQHFAVLTTAFPDLHITIEVILDEADRDATRAAARWFVQATHTGNFGDIPPTGKRVRVTGTAIVQVSNRQIVQEHANSDALGLLRQIGPTTGAVKIPPLIF